MTGYTPIYNLPYPQASDLVSAYPGTGQDLAEEVETVLAAKAATSALKVLQIVVATTTTQVSTTSTSYVDSGLSASITPTSASSKILVILNQQFLCNRSAAVNALMRLQLLRASTVIQAGTPEQFGVYDNASVDRGLRGYVVMQCLDAPASTSSLTYKTQMRIETSGDLFAQYSSASSSMTLMEVVA